MKFILVNYSEFRKKLSDGSQKMKTKDYPFFCMILGYMLSRIQEFDSLYNAIELALTLLIQDKLPEPQFFDWIMFLYNNPYRLDDCTAFLQYVSQEKDIDIFDEIQTLMSSNVYKKHSLASKNRYNSVDTVVLGNENGSKQKIEQIYQPNQALQNDFEKDYNLEMLRKMEEDQQFARKMQAEQQQFAKEQRLNMKVQQTMCQICYVDLYQGNPFFLDKCGHGFHQECLSEGFKAQIIDNNFPLKCPNQQCKTECLERDIKYILTEDLYKKYQDHTLKAYADTHGDTVSWCPTADCGYMFFYEKDDQPRFQCLQCKKEYCLNCRCEWHKDMSCAEYKVSTTISQSDKLFLDFVKGKKFKQCPKCKFWVQKNEGCDHMTCKCKFQFCYKCGGIYQKCECMQKIREEAERRRLQRQETNRRKAEKKAKMAQELKSKGKDVQPSRRGRSKKQGKK